MFQDVRATTGADGGFARPVEPVSVVETENKLDACSLSLLDPARDGGNHRAVVAKQWRWAAVA